MTDSQAPIEPVKRSINSLTAFCKAIGATNPEVVGSATQTWLDPAILEEDPRCAMRIYDSPKVQAHIESLVEAWMDNDHIPMVEVQVVDGRCYIRKGVCRTAGNQAELQCFTERFPPANHERDQVQHRAMLYSRDLGIPGRREFLLFSVEENALGEVSVSTSRGLTLFAHDLI